MASEEKSSAEKAMKKMKKNEDSDSDSVADSVAVSSGCDCDCDLKNAKEEDDDEIVATKKKQKISCCGECHLKKQNQNENENKFFKDDRDGSFFISDKYEYFQKGENFFNKELWDKCWKQIRESEGFDIQDFIYCGMSPFRPVHDIGPDSRPFQLAKYALEDNFDEPYELVRLIKVNQAMVGAPTYYITFEARIPDDPPITFQARVWDARSPYKVEVELCRIKPKHLTSSSSSS